MESSGFKKFIFGGVIILLLAPLFVFAQEISTTLKEKQVIDILDIVRKNPLSKNQGDIYFEAIYYPDSNTSAKAGAMMLTKQAILQSELDYWFVKMPVEFSKRFIKAVYKLLPAVAYGDFSGAIDLIEKYTVEQANKYIGDWLKQNQAQIGSGIGKYAFPSYKNNPQVINIPYIIVYSPIGINKAKIVVEFYSKTAIEPPQNRGSYGCPDGVVDWLTSTCWPWDIWLQSRYNKNSKTPNKIEPFIVRVKGQVVKDKYGNFSWDKTAETPSVEVEFGKPVPEIDQSDIILAGLEVNQSQGFIKDKINEIKQKAQGIIDQIKQFFAIFKPQAQISSFVELEEGSPPQLPQELVDIAEESQEIVEQAEEIITEENADILDEDLLKIKADLEQAIKEKQAELDKILLDILIVENATTTPLETGSLTGQATTTIATTTLCSQATNQESSFGKIIFNEIAWMGTTKSASDEWIELKNISVRQIDLNGWQIFNKSQNLKIFFTTTTIVSPGGFLLLERTDDNTVPAIKADRIYTGALANTDEMLYLVSPNCVLQDKIKAVPYWQEGDNATKETMERNQFYGWQTSSVVGGTPKAKNSIGKDKPSSGGGGATNNQLLITNNQNTTSTASSTQDATTTQNATTTEQATTTATSTEILIVEIQTEDSSSTQNDFIKLFNYSTSSAVDIAGWQFKKRSSIGSESLIKIIGSGLVIQPQEYFAWLNSGYATSVSFAVVTSTQTISGTTSVALLNKTNEPIDQVAWGFGTDPFVEGQPFGQNPQAGQNLIRKYSTTTQRYQDTNNNSADFELSNSGQASSTQQATSSPNILIVEIQTEDSSSTQNDFIKLFNYSTSSAVDISDWQLKKRNSNSNEESIKKFTSRQYLIQPQNYFLWMNSGYALTTTTKPDATTTETIASNNSIALFNVAVEIIDQVAWGFGTDPFVEGQPFGQNPQAGQNLIRKFSTTTNQYQDTRDNSADFELATSTEQLLIIDNSLPGIVNLMAIPSTVRGAVDLFWICSTSSAGYIIKKSDQEISTSSWDTAEIISQNIAPKPSGEVEFLQVGGLDASKKYYFAIKYIGLPYGTSTISNVVFATAWKGFQDNGETLTDLRTNLTWLKSATSSINNSGASSTQDNAIAFMAGQTPWRLANLKELASLFNYASSSPSFWGGFENIIPETYWSKNNLRINPFDYPATHYLGWNFNFQNGAVGSEAYDGGNSNLYRFLATQGQEIPGGIGDSNADITYNTDGTIKDNRTGLSWLNNSFVQRDNNAKNWSSAFLFAANAVLCNDGTLQGTASVVGDCSANGGVKYDDWRLGNVQEMLESYGILSWRDGFYWTGSIFDDNNFWQVGNDYYSMGTVSHGNKNNPYSVQLVRDP